MQPCDVERIYSTDRKLLCWRDGKTVLVDLDEEPGMLRRVAYVALTIGGIALYLAVMGGIVYLVSKGLKSL